MTTAVLEPVLNAPKKPTRNGLGVSLVRGLFKKIGPLAPGLMGWYADALWFSPRRFKRPGWEQALLDTADDHYIQQLGATRVPVWGWGKGPVVLLVHGWEGRGSQMGAFLQPLLALGYRVVCFDAPGHGSAPGHRTDAVELRWLIDLISQREGGLFGVISHSFGAIPSALAIREGLELNRAVFISAPSDFHRMVAQFQRFLSIPEVVMARLTQRIQNRFPEFGRQIWTQLSTHINAGHFGKVVGMVIHDEDDEMVPVSQSRLIANSWAKATRLETRGLGHHRILKDPDVVLSVAKFFQPISAR